MLPSQDVSGGRAYPPTHYEREDTPGNFAGKKIGLRNTTSQHMKWRREKKTTSQHTLALGMPLERVLNSTSVSY